MKNTDLTEYNKDNAWVKKLERDERNFKIVKDKKVKKTKYVSLNQIRAIRRGQHGRL